jgi:hypothetical protein
MAKPLQAILKTTLDRMGQWTEALQAGTFSHAEWRDAMVKSLFEGHAATYMYATHKRVLTVEDQRIIAQGVAFHLKKLNAFADDLKGRDVTARDLARARMYAGSIKETYSRGSTGGLPLPTYPTKTACMTNCKCVWKVDWISRANGDANCYWQRHADDSCETCIANEAQYNPYRVRGGKGK